MTAARKPNDHSHFSYSPTSGLRDHSYTSAVFVTLNLRERGKIRFRAARGLNSGPNAGRAPHRVPALRIRSRVLWWGVASWEPNQAFQSRNRQTLAGANLRPKKSGLWTREFPSATSRSSHPQKRQSNFWLSARAATPAPQNAGLLARAGHPMPPSMRSGPTSIHAIAERRRA